VRPSTQAGKILHLHAHPEIQWLQDAGRVLVVDQEGRAGQWLDGDAALIWSWLNSGVSSSQCIKLLAALNEVEPAQAANVIVSCLADWRESGLIHCETEV
jgi:hypothetical protein